MAYEYKGLLLEDTITNYFSNSDDFTDGTKNGITTSIVGSGIEDGIPYTDLRFHGTATGSTDIIMRAEASAAQGQWWTSSSYVKRVGGTTNGVVSAKILIVEQENFTTYIGDSQTADFKDETEFKRYTISREFTNANALEARIAGVISLTSGEVIDITFRFGQVQLEKNNFASSPIITTTAPATRAADVFTVEGSGFSNIFNLEEGTIVVEFQCEPAPIGSVSRFFSITDNSGISNYIGALVDTAGILLFKINSIHNIGASYIPKDSPSKFVFAYKSGNNNLFIDGVEIADSAFKNDTFNLSGVDRFTIGRAGDGSRVTPQMKIKKFIYYPKRISDSQLGNL